jgi:iron complex outermembrane recepter protein
MYGEFDFPIVKSLDLDLAAREEHYSGAIGSNLRPQATLRWQPLHQITMRASYADGFRAPSLAEASNSESLAHQNVFDPLDPQHRATETIGYVTGGNPLVKPEISKNLDLGLVISPMSHVDLSVDYYSLYLYRVIAPNATAQQIIDDPTAYPGELVRSANGTIIYAEALYTNQFEIHTSGFDINANVSVPLAAAGELTFGADALPSSGSWWRRQACGQIMWAATAGIICRRSAGAGRCRAGRAISSADGKIRTGQPEPLFAIPPATRIR